MQRKTAYDQQKWQEHFTQEEHEFSTSNDSSLLKIFIRNWNFSSFIRDTREGFLWRSILQN